MLFKLVSCVFPVPCRAAVSEQPGTFVDFRGHADYAAVHELGCALVLLLATLKLRLLLRRLCDRFVARFLITSAGLLV